MSDNVPVNNMAALAALLGLNEIPVTMILGRPPKDSKSLKVKSFAKRIQKTK